MGYANFVVKGNNTLMKGLKFRSKSSKAKYRLLKVQPNIGSTKGGDKVLITAGISVVLDTIKACYGQNLESIRCTNHGQYGRCALQTPYT